jgi:hypothetical protein
VALDKNTKPYPKNPVHEKKKENEIHKNEINSHNI